MSTLVNHARTRIPRFAEAAVQRAGLRVVRRPAPELSRTPFVTLVVLLLAGGVAGLLAFNTSMQQTSFRTTAMEVRAHALAARQQALLMDLQRLRDPQQLATAAKRMGMVPPPNPAFLRLSDGRILGRPVPATSKDAMRINPLPASRPSVLAPAPRVIRVPAPTVSSTAKASTTGRKKAHTTAGGVRR